MIVQYMRVKYGHGYTGATHMTKVFVKGTILFLQCMHVTDVGFHVPHTLLPTLSVCKHTMSCSALVNM